MKKIGILLLSVAVVWSLASFAIQSPAYALDIVINAGSGLTSNSDALAAFNRAAGQWSSKFSDPITVTINADLQPLGPGILNSTNPVMLLGSYSTIRNPMVTDAAPYANNSIVASLPTKFTALIPNGFGTDTNMKATKANLKAMGFDGLDAVFGVSDGVITISTNFNFAYNHASLASGKYDFETVAAREIGHVLGFISAVDDVDNSLHNAVTTTITPTPLDLFRFRPSDNPTTPDQFTQNSRSLLTGRDSPSDFSDTANVYAFSTGEYTGDGRKANTWKDDVLTGTWIGLMDPTLADNVFFNVAYADVRALDLIGYDAVPIPGTPWILLLMLDD